jgi:(1->4)-alpha-D-glucan 1-alpha-D-glucosylmutase
VALSKYVAKLDGPTIAEVATGAQFANRTLVAGARTPLSTYRLQFNARFTFTDASQIVPYLDELGIGDCYASSYLAAVPGSPHGYDVADPTRLNPDLGADEDYWGWIDALRSRGMGHVLDLVPNHMGIAKSANPWWLDVLENGPSSRFARFFDIEWHPVKDELADKLLIPILGDQYGAVLERQELQLAYANGAFVIKYYDDTLPVAPDTYGIILQDELGPWLASHPGDHGDELQSILTASEHLPPRSSRDPEAIALRAREKEIVKRRLAALAVSPEVDALIRTCLRRFNGIAGQPRSFDRLDGLLNAQSYRLAHWRVASEEINYRRFFDVNQLAALRMEDPAVFAEVHRFVFELIRRGAATGLRIDHVDGLFAPGDYLQRLQSQLSSDATFYIVVEKILGRDEELSSDWPVHGTTGYEFAAVVNNLFVDRRNERALDDIYRRFVRQSLPFDDLVYRSKKRVLHETMSGDINSLGHQLNRFSERNRHFRDFTLYSLISTLKEVIACFPVYRTYVGADGPDQTVSDHDRRYIDQAVQSAKQRTPAVTALVFDFIERLLLKQTRITSSEECEARAKFIGKFQQITSPVAAKGLEDTALYIYNRLLSLNEVGADPMTFGMEPAAVHQWMIQRQQQWPAALSATSTHDTKRGEDVRARLNVLSELPGAWKGTVARWRALNRRFKSEVNGVLAPDGNVEYHLYQTLVGAWPFGHDAASDPCFRERIAAYMMKALREAKVHTSWLSPDEEYERAVTRFVDAVLDRRRSNPFLASFLPFQARVAELGIYNSLAQLVIKVTAPGVPDFYQGTELWDLNLVDPDNRRPVDYTSRQQMLASLGTDPDILDLLEHRTDGRIKMFVMARALAARAEWRDVYEQGAYVPLTTSGAGRDSLFAFARVGAGSSCAITCVPRLFGSLMPDASGPPVGRGIWNGTRVELPSGRVDPKAALRDVFTGAELHAEQVDGRWTLPAAALFERLPVSLLVPSTPCST